MLEQSIKKPRLETTPNSSDSAKREAVIGESEANASPLSKRAEQRLRVSFHVTVVYIIGS